MLPEHENDPVLEIIDRVDKIICDEEHWGQGSWSRGSCVRPLMVRTPDGGRRHCPRTALFECDPTCRHYIAVDGYFKRAVAEIDPSVPGAHPAFYNNRPERKFAEIVALIAKARALRVADLMKDKVLVVIGPGRQARH